MVILSKSQKTLAFIGSYADSSNSGVYTCQYGESNGSLEIIHEVDGLQNPTFLSVDKENCKLYAISEGTDASGQRCGAASSYDIDTASGKLTF